MVVYLFSISTISTLIDTVLQSSHQTRWPCKILIQRDGEEWEGGIQHTPATLFMIFCVIIPHNFFTISISFFLILSQ